MGAIDLYAPCQSWTFIHQFLELILLWFIFQDNFLYLVLLHFLLIELHPSIEIHYADPDVVLKGYKLLDKIVDIQIFLYIVFHCKKVLSNENMRIDLGDSAKNQGHTFVRETCAPYAPPFRRLKKQISNLLKKNLNIRAFVVKTENIFSLIYLLPRITRQ